MTTYGYARVSTDQQDLSVQINQLKEFGCQTILEEKASGKDLDGRPVLMTLLKTVQAGDTIVVSKFDRIGRSLKDFLEIIEQLAKKGVHLISVAEKFTHIQDENTRALIMNVMVSIAQFERGRILERTNAGREEAMKKGVRFGRKPKLSAEDLELIKTLDRGGATRAEIASRLGVGVATVYRHLKVA